MKLHEVFLGIVCIIAIAMFAGVGRLFTAIPALAAEAWNWLF